MTVLGDHSMCRRVKIPKYVSLVVWLGDQLPEKQILKIILDFFDKIVSFLINILQHEQYYLIIILIGLKAANSLKKRLWHRCFSVNFGKFLGTTFYRTHPGDSFWIKFCKS